MTPEQITLVQSSFGLVKPIADQAATIFYDKLFAIDPSLRSMFPADMTEQKRKLMAMLGTAVGALKQPEALIPVVQKLGRSHVAYGVKDEHYPIVGAALIYTLGAGLGDAFTPEVHEAWGEAYSLLSSVMIEASHTAA
ncbi:globin family protein [soil metagenome]